MTPQLDPRAWQEAGGNTHSLEVYEAIGRVAPFTDGDSRCLATIHPNLPEVGAIGDWVGGDDVRIAAERWLKDQGCRVVRGPMEMASWFRYRATLGPFDEPPFTFEPTGKADRWLAADYEVCAEYVSWLANSAEQIKLGSDRAGALSASGWTIHPLPSGPDGKVGMGSFIEAVQMVHNVASEAYAETTGYVDVPAEILQQWFAPYREILDPRLTLLARTPEGRVAGFVLAIPDFVQPERKWFLVKTLAVLPEYRQNGVGSWLVAACHRAAQRAGFRQGVHCMVRASGGIARFATTGRAFRRYALLEKGLE